MTVVANFVSYNDTIAILVSRAHHVNLKTLSTFTTALPHLCLCAPGYSCQENALCQYACPLGTGCCCKRSKPH